MTVPEGDEMSELERLDEALAQYDETAPRVGIYRAPMIASLVDAARAYRDLLAIVSRLLVDPPKEEE